MGTGRKNSIALRSGIAFDRAASNRRYDQDGHLHVVESNISRATVNPYKGSEVPMYKELGLDPDRIYQIFRDPVELEKGASSFHGKPLEIVHKAQNAKDHDRTVVVGAVYNPKFEPPFLKAELVVWDGEAIKLVEDEEQKELSCGYHYTYVPGPGNFEGLSYDGKMIGIAGNHVTLVETGRAGSDVVVADAALDLGGAKRARRKGSTMPQHNAIINRAMTVNALVAGIRPLLAMDAAKAPEKAFSVTKALTGVTGKNFKAKKAGVLASLTEQLQGKLAQDASMESLAELLDMIETHEVESGVDESVTEPQHKAMEAAAHGQSKLGIPEKVGKEFAEADKPKKSAMDWARDWLSGKGMSEDDISEFESMAEQDGAEDEEPEAEEPTVDEEDDEAKKKAEEEKRAKDKKAKDAKAAKDRKMGKDNPPPFPGAPKPGGKDGKDAEMVSKGAMDEAIKKASDDTAARVRKEQQAINEALREVKPIVGELTVAFDSAENVYKAVLEAKKVDIAGVPPAAFRAMVKMIPAESTTRPREPMVAMDSEATKSFHTRYPGTESIRVAR